MTKLGMWGLVGVALGCTVALPAQAQLADMSKAAIGAAGKIASKISGKEISATTVAKDGGVSATAVAASASTDKSARITFLDKQTNRRQTLVLIAGEPQTVGTLVVQLTKCMPDYSATLGQDVAWLDVNEGADGSGRSAPWFSGWMFNTYPEISTLDHPRYDMQLQGCGVKARQVVKASGAAPVIETAEPVVDTETPNDAPVASGSDPYYVPGVEKVTPTTPAPASEAAPEATIEMAPQQPAAEAPVQAPVEATPAEEGQGDLHRMMDSGTY